MSPSGAAKPSPLSAHVPSTSRSQSAVNTTSRYVPLLSPADDMASPPTFMSPLAMASTEIADLRARVAYLMNRLDTSERMNVSLTAVYKQSQEGLAAAHAAQRGLIERVQALEAELEAAQERRTDSATKEDALASLRRQLKSLKEEALMSEERIEELTAAQAEVAAVRQRERDQLNAAERACAEATAAAARWQQRCRQAETELHAIRDEVLGGGSSSSPGIRPPAAPPAAADAADAADAAAAAATIATLQARLRDKTAALEACEARLGGMKKALSMVSLAASPQGHVPTGRASAGPPMMSSPDGGWSPMSWNPLPGPDAAPAPRTPTPNPAADANAAASRRERQDLEEVIRALQAAAAQHRDDLAAARGALARVEADRHAAETEKDRLQAAAAAAAAEVARLRQRAAALAEPFSDAALARRRDEVAALQSTVAALRADQVRQARTTHSSHATPFPSQPRHMYSLRVGDRRPRTRR